MPKLKKPREMPSPPVASRPDWIVAGLALVGLVVAGYDKAGPGGRPSGSAGHD